MESPSLLVLIVMAIQVFGPFLFKSKIGDKARNWITVANGIVSAVTSVINALVTAAGHPATTSMNAADNVMLAGFFGSFGNIFVDVLKDTLVQWFLVSGAFNAPQKTAKAFGVGKVTS